MENLKHYKYRKCTICGVRKLPKSNILLSSFPLDPDRCRLWVKATGDEDLAQLPIEKLHELKFLCGSHFAPDCFNEKGNRLFKSAVPTEKLLKPPLSDEYLKEFPLHVKSLHAKEKDIKGEQIILNAKEPCASSNEFIPVPSTSKAPLNLMLKRKCEDVPSQEGDDVKVQSYKRSRISDNKISGLY